MMILLVSSDVLVLCWVIVIL